MNRCCIFVLAAGMLLPLVYLFYEIVEFDQPNVMLPSELSRNFSFQKVPNVLETLLHFLNETKSYPVIIGGIGDSGTRGIRQVLRDLGVQLLNQDDVNHFGDSLIFEETYLVYNKEHDEWAERSARDLYKNGVHRARTLSYNVTHFSPKTWEFGRQFIGAMLFKSLKASRRVRKDKPLGVWGMKHPRTMFLLPFIYSALGNQVKFVHVVRDPKAVVVGHNQQMFLGECHRYYGGGEERKCPKTLVQRFQFWADTNREILNFAKQYLTPQSYLMVRTEDFVLGSSECFTRIADFVGLENVEPSRYRWAINSSMSHVSSYFGLSLTEPVKKEVFAALKATTDRLDHYNRESVKETVDLFGYSQDSFSLTKSCLELPSP